MLTATDPLLRFAAETATDPMLARDAIPAVWPIVARARMGRYDIARETVFTAEELRSAISAAVRLPVRSVTLLSTATPFQSYGATYEREVPFIRSLTVRLNEAWQRRIEKAYASRVADPSWEVFRAELRSRIRAAVSDPLGLTHDPFETPVSSVGESLAASLFHFISALVVGERTAVTAIRPLIVTLTKTIPVGESGAQDGVWLSVLVPPRPAGPPEADA